MIRIGIDLGGTKIEGIALAASGRVAAGRRVATPRDDYDGTVRAIAALVGALEAEAGSRGTVGIGMPGAISPATGLVKNANSTWLNGQPLQQDLERALGRARAAGQRRQLLRALRGRATARRPARRWSSASSSAPAPAAASSCAAAGAHRAERGGGGVGTQPAAVAGAGGVAGRGRVTAAGAGASRRSCPAPVWRATTSARPASRMQQRGDRRARGRRRCGRPRRRSAGTRRGWRARWRASSTCSIPMSSCSAAACRSSTACTRTCPRSGRRGCSPTASTRGWSPPRHGDASGVRGAAWLWPRARFHLICLRNCHIGRQLSASG